eukprot:7386159-Prymnesium_polylepis.1
MHLSTSQQRRAKRPMQQLALRGLIEKPLNRGLRLRRRVQHHVVKVQAQKSVEVSSQSTLVSLCGSFVAFVVLFFLGSIAVERFFAFEPSMSEVSVESEGAELELPGIAFTINVPGWSESRLLDF